MSRDLRALTALAITVSLAGCKVGPNYKRPVVDVPNSYRGAMAPEIAPPTAGTPAGAAPKTPLGAQAWQSVFTDPVLQKLIAAALKNNYDVKIAADRVLEEQAQLGITRSAAYPTFSAGPSYDVLGLPGSFTNQLNNSSNSSSSSNSSNNGPAAYYAGGFMGSVSWNLDFWGYYRRQTEAARAYLRATEWARQMTYSTLIENVATAYYQLRMLDSELAITKATVAARKQSLDLTIKLEQGGANSLADVRQAQELAYTAQGQIPDIEREIGQQENNLRLLLGQDPGPIARGKSIADAPHPDDIPVGLPSNLLERRPDVRRAEQLLIQANANIGVARAEYFPQLSLTGAAGTASSQLNGLVSPGNVYYYAAGGLTQPIFDAGKIRNNYRLALAAHKELLDTYQQTIAGALRDVSNALIAYNKEREYRERLELQTAAAADAVRLARIRYDSGSTSYLEVLTTDTDLYTSQLALRAAEEQEAISLVQLYNALGGGW